MTEQLEDTPGYLNSSHQIAVLEAKNAHLRRDNERLRAVLEQTLENIANKKVPRQNIAGPIRAALNKQEW